MMPASFGAGQPQAAMEPAAVGYPLSLDRAVRLVSCTEGVGIPAPEVAIPTPSGPYGTAFSLTLSGILELPRSAAQGSPGLRPGDLALVEVVLESGRPAGRG